MKKTKNSKTVFKKRESIEILAAVCVLLLVVAGYLFFAAFGCGKQREAAAFMKLDTASYFWGAKSCPVTWKLKGLNEEELKKIPSDKKIQVISAVRDPELESILKNNFLGYNRYAAGEDQNMFYVYETICGVCTKKK